MTKYYVYALYRDVELTDPFYIGKGQGKRVKAHEWEVKSGKAPNSRKCQAVRKRLKAFGFVPHAIIAGGLTEGDAYALEVELIARYGRLDRGTGTLTNATDGGDGGSGHVIGDEARGKIRAARAKQRPPTLGMKTSAETRAKMSAAAKGRGLGVKRGPRSPETAAKISKGLTGKTLSDATKDKLRAANLGKTMSEEARAKISAAFRGESGINTGRKASMETREKNRAAAKGNKNRLGKTHSDETKEKLRAAASGDRNPNKGGLSADHKLKISLAHRARRQAGNCDAVIL